MTSNIYEALSEAGFQVTIKTNGTVIVNGAIYRGTDSEHAAQQGARGILKVLEEREQACKSEYDKAQKRAEKARAALRIFIE